MKFFLSTVHLNYMIALPSRHIANSFSTTNKLWNGKVKLDQEDPTLQVVTSVCVCVFYL